MPGDNPDRGSFAEIDEALRELAMKQNYGSLDSRLLNILLFLVDAAALGEIITQQELWAFICNGKVKEEKYEPEDDLAKFRANLRDLYDSSKKKDYPAHEASAVGAEVNKLRLQLAEHYERLQAKLSPGQSYLEIYIPKQGETGSEKGKPYLPKVRRIVKQAAQSSHKPPGPVAFFSYTANGNHHSGTLDAAISVVTELLKSRRWHVIDPRYQHGNADISRADCLFVFPDGDAPDRLHLGFAKALGLPRICLSEYEAPSFDYEIRYTAEEIARGFPDLPGHLSRLEDSLLAFPRRKLLRRSIDLVTTVHRILENKSNHPRLLLQSGLVDFFNQELQKSRLDEYDCDPKVYPFALRDLRHWPGPIQAVADLTDDIEEDLWRKTANPLDTAVTERIFVVSPADMFPDEQSQRGSRTAGLFSFLIGLSTNQNSNFIHVLKPEQSHWSQFQQNQVGRHLLAISPDEVLGYVKSPDRTPSHQQHSPARPLLRMQQSQDLWATAVKEYGQFRDASIPINRNSTFLDLRNAWIEKENLGYWDEHWNEVSNRRSAYCNRYDINIRLWIPKYADLLEWCARKCETEITDLSFARNNEPLNILEIGTGTGALTTRLIAGTPVDAALMWPHSIGSSLPRVGVDLSSQIKQYIGVDCIGVMNEVLDKRLSIIRKSVILPHCELLQAKALEEEDLLNRLSSIGKVDVVVGSLVLHDLIRSQELDDGPVESYDEIVKAVTVNFKRFMRLAATLNASALIFADPFTSSRSAVRERQIAYWKKSNSSGGLVDFAGQIARNRLTYGG